MNKYMIQIINENHTIHSKRISFVIHKFPRFIGVFIGRIHIYTAIIIITITAVQKYARFIVVAPGVRGRYMHIDTHAYAYERAIYTYKQIGQNNVYYGYIHIIPLKHMKMCHFSFAFAQ